MREEAVLEAAPFWGPQEKPILALELEEGREAKLRSHAENKAQKYKKPPSFSKIPFLASIFPNRGKYFFFLASSFQNGQLKPANAI